VASSVRLGQLTTLRMGGAPRRYVRPASERELRQALRACRLEGLAWRVLGGGSNLLVEDGPLPFAVIHVCAPAFSAIERVGPCSVRVGAGAPTARLLSFCKEHALGGLEFLAGIPGTVGGALAGNAGAWGRSIADSLSSVCLVHPDGGTRVLARTELAFGYRTSLLTGCVVTEAAFTLEPRNPRLIALQMGRYARARAKRHPTGQHSAGCIFKNPACAPAGKLLDLCGLKGHAVGSAQISPVHANFIVNNGKATPRQVLQLIEVMKDAVRRRFGVELELEVRHWGADSIVA